MRRVWPFSALFSDGLASKGKDGQPNFGAGAEENIIQLMWDSDVSDLSGDILYLCVRQQIK